MKGGFFILFGDGGHRGRVNKTTAPVSHVHDGATRCLPAQLPCECQSSSLTFYSPVIRPRAVLADADDDAHTSCSTFSVRPRSSLHTTRLVFHSRVFLICTHSYLTTVLRCFLASRIFFFCTLPVLKLLDIINAVFTASPSSYTANSTYQNAEGNSGHWTITNRLELIS